VRYRLIPGVYWETWVVDVPDQRLRSNRESCTLPNKGAFKWTQCRVAYDPCIGPLTANVIKFEESYFQMTAFFNFECTIGQVNKWNFGFYFRIFQNMNVSKRHLCWVSYYAELDMARVSQFIFLKGFIKLLL
jgi:hypothetical protein